MFVTEIGRQCRAITLGFTCSIDGTCLEKVVGNLDPLLTQTLARSSPRPCFFFLPSPFSPNEKFSEKPLRKIHELPLHEHREWNKDSKFTISKIPFPLLLIPLVHVEIGKCLVTSGSSNKSHEIALSRRSDYTGRPMLSASC